LLTLEEQLNVADVVIGAVLVAGARAPRLVSRSQLSIMKRTAVMIDVAIDQGGCFETSHPTTHSDPTYVVDGIVHYCVANMPGAVPVTATLALTNATLPYVLALANGSTASPSSLNPNLLSGLNISRGRITCEAVAIAHDLEFTRMQPPDGDRENVGVPA
jgi:alanine dehydrogenase